jgi:membrane protein implicated in regulation of membrane protease activity
MFSSSSAFAAGGVLFLVLYLVGSLIVFLIGIWISYSVIWRAVRRGLKEYHKDNPGTPAP